MPVTYDSKGVILVFVVTVFLTLYAPFGSTSARIIARRGSNQKLMKAPSVEVTAFAEPRGIRADVTFVNRDSRPFPLLRWNLPSNGELTANIFEVDRDGQRQSYRGELIKRHVTKDDYILLENGKQYRTSINLEQAYDVNRPGEYRIRYRAWNQLPDGRLVAIASAETIVRKP